MSSRVLDIKSAVSILCKHLNLLFNLDLTIETFRLAKFNKNEKNIVEVFWNILKHFLSSDLHPDNIVEDIKRYLRKLNYKNREFYKLTYDTNAPRELLLALGYILSKGELDRIVQRKCKESLFHEERNLGSSDKMCPISFNSSIQRNESELTEATKWLKGKANYYQRIVKDYQVAVTTILKKLDERSTFSFDLTLPELKAINDNDYGRHFLISTKWIIQVLDNHDQWLKREHVFWEWMKTVIVEYRTVK